MCTCSRLAMACSVAAQRLLSFCTNTDSSLHARSGPTTRQKAASQSSAEEMTTQP